jgi:polyvinyl alcohol dehydrogenase (cytochrome)
MFRITVVLFGVAVSAFAQAPDGKALFAANCAMCHAPGGDARAPLPEVLQQRPNESIVVALEAGAMRSQGARITALERRAIADYLSPKTAASEQPARANNCATNPQFSNLDGWNGWGVDLTNSRLQSTAAAGLRAEDIPKLKVKWAFGIPYEVTVEAQPTVVGGRLFFGSATGPGDRAGR